MPIAEQKLTRIGVFYDGNFFYHVSTYYNYYHSRRSRISISGLHNFIRQQVANSEGSDIRYCQIVDAHYFRGRVRAQDAQERSDLLFKERLFEDVLLREGVTTHYLHLGPEGEKGIDVWLALEAYELAIYKRFDVSVLVASDGDFLPLVRKLNTIGTRVMLLAWDFEYTDQNRSPKVTRTAQVLLDEVTYPVMMHQVIDDRSKKDDPLIKDLFVPHKEFQIHDVIATINEPATPTDNLVYGTIQSLKGGYGWITPSYGGNNVYFYYKEVINVDFNDLRVGEQVEFELDTNDKGPCATRIRAIE